MKSAVSADIGFPHSCSNLLHKLAKELVMKDCMNVLHSADLVRGGVMLLGGRVSDMLSVLV